MKRGLLVVLSGPSGVGKGTIRDLFIRRPELNLTFSISMTTRTQRAGEVDGVDYYFVSRERFEEAISKDELLEYAEFVGNYYGTPIAEVERLRDLGKNVVLEIEVQGAIQIKEKCPDALTIFVVPPSMEELERRIRGRRSEPAEIIQQRLSKASREMELTGQYRYVVCNEDPQLAADIVSVIIKRHMEAISE
ncbi:MAG TPA: guanylate kinase [Erysipelotrichaceae bacterium]|nr:guanylate kinase [Erysipelotrichaceae bacterium]